MIDMEAESQFVINLNAHQEASADLQNRAHTPATMIELCGPDKSQISKAFGLVIV